MAEETLMKIMLVMLMLVGSYISGNIPLVIKLFEEKESLYTETSIPTVAQALPQTSASAPLSAAAVAQNEHQHAHSGAFQRDHSSTIGLPLVLGFVFMMLVDRVSQRQSAANDKNITATLGLVVHAAADGVALGAAATTSHQDVEMIVFLAIMLHKAPAAFGLEQKETLNAVNAICIAMLFSAGKAPTARLRMLSTRN